jgi:NhaP-type Na+/H+ or K+/H+ antiporter
MSSRILSNVTTENYDYPLNWGADWNREKLNEIAQNTVVGVSGAALVSFVVVNFVNIKHLSFVPEPLVVVIIGAIFGFYLWWDPIIGQRDDLSQPLVEWIFGLWLTYAALPVLMFEAGWSLRLRDFVSQLGYILFFAIIGTVISMIVVAYLILWTSDYHGIVDKRTAFAYGALISSVDPVATLSTFNHLNVDPLLYILVFGEASINDAVAIAIFDTLNESGVHDIDGGFIVAWRVVKLFCGSALLGLALGVAFILILRLTRLNRSPAEATLFIFVSCFFTFAFAEMVQMSGIITVLFNSIFVGMYAGAHLSPQEMTLASFLLKQTATLMDMSIFMLCGVEAVFAFTSDDRHGALFGLCAALFCVVGRFFAVYPMAFVSNMIKERVGKKLPAERRHLITNKHMLMMWHSGLRGGVSLKLAMDFGPWVNDLNQCLGEGDSCAGADVRQQIITGTFVMICTYLLVFGSTTGLCLRTLGLPMGDQVLPGQNLYESDDKDGVAWRKLHEFRHRVLYPILVGHNNDNDEGDDNDNTADPLDMQVQQHDSTASDRRRERAATCPMPRRPMAKGRADTEVMLDLYGTCDPAHAHNIADQLAWRRHQSSDAVTA